MIGGACSLEAVYLFDCGITECIGINSEGAFAGGDSYIFESFTIIESSCSNTGYIITDSQSNFIAIGVSKIVANTI